MKLTIITPCYNSEKTIERTINSVIRNANELDLEYIIVDGKSSDGTLQLIERYQKEYPQIISYISEKDNSMTEALNKGLKLAHGDIIGSINADDEYLPHALPQIVDAFETRKCDVLMADSYYVVEETGRILSKGKPKFFSELFCAFTECLFPECGIFYKKECVNNVGMFNEKYKYTQDFEFYLRMLHYGYKFDYQEIPLSIFYRSDNNYSSTITDKMNAEVCDYFKYKKIFSIFAQSPFSKLLKIISGTRIYYLRTRNVRELY